MLYAEEQGRNQVTRARNRSGRKHHQSANSDGLENSSSSTTTLTSLLTSSKKKTQLTYSTFIAGLKADNIALNRKILSDFAEKEPLSFGALAARVRALQEKGKVSAGSGSGS